MAPRIAYNVLLIIIFAALGYGLGKTGQLMKAGGDLVSQATPIWILVAVVVVVCLIARFVIRKKLSGK